MRQIATGKRGQLSLYREQRVVTLE